MRIGEAFPSKYLKAQDIPAAQMIPVIIDRIEIDNVGTEEKPEHKPVMFFKGKQKGLVLNKTNAEAISVVYGDETDSWIGRSISLFAATTSFQGKTMPCLRVAVAKATPPAQRQAPPPQVQRPVTVPAEDPFTGTAGNEFKEDDIPF